MIAHLNGTVARIEANSVVMDVHGVGYRVFVPLTALSALPEPGGTALLHTTMIMREDGMTLYGFSALEEQQIFEIVTQVSGVGPKAALSLLSVMDASELARAISSNDLKALTRVPGVGQKLAQRLILETGERLAEFAFARRVDALAARKSPQDVEAHEDIVEALVNLGYSRPDSRKAADRVLSNAQGRADTPTLIREALNLLSGGSRR